MDWVVDVKKLITGIVVIVLSLIIIPFPSVVLGIVARPFGWVLAVPYCIGGIFLYNAFEQDDYEKQNEEHKASKDKPDVHTTKSRTDV